ncbi:hypothetical protein GTW38_02105, partial [Streptomyces sp. SID7804]|nr:hypothetical protein [Streptomyces sp. SID7804]
TQRRALVATAVAMVGGGITLASLDRGTGDGAQAASAPDLKGMGGKSPLDRYGDPSIPTPGPERTEESSEADDERTRPADDTPASNAPSDTRTDGAAASGSAVSTQPRTTSPDTGSGARQNTTTGGDSGSDSSAGSGSDGGSATGGPAPSTQPSTPPPAADDSTGTGSDSGAGQDTGGSEPAPSTPPATTPDSDRLCLLVICLGK